MAEWLVRSSHRGESVACPTLPWGRLFPSRQEAQGRRAGAVLLTGGSEQWGGCSGISGYQLPVFRGVAVFSQAAARGRGIVLDG